MTPNPMKGELMRDFDNLFPSRATLMDGLTYIYVDGHPARIKKWIKKSLDQYGDARAEAERQRVVEVIEKKRLLEAAFPGSKYTLEWKQAHNAVIDKILSVLQTQDKEKG